jgi:NitT/TauT family transport system substrate-binding protein
MRRTIIAALGLLIAAAGSAAAQGKGETVRFQSYGPGSNMLIDVAIAKGYCEKHGIVCQTQVIANGPLGAQALIAKNIEVGYFPVEVLVNAALKGAALKAVVGGATRNSFELVVGKDLATPNAEKGYPALMQDLKGKKIGVPARGSGAEIQFRFLAVKAGMSPDDFIYVAVGAPATSYGALNSKQIDASMSFGPSASLCDVLKTCRTLYILGDAKEPPEVAKTEGASSNMVVRQETIDTAPHVVEAIIAASKDAEAFVQNPANFDELLKIAQVEAQFNFPGGREVGIMAIKRYLPGFKAAISRSAAQQIADNMLEMKQIEQRFDTSKVIYDKAP